MRQTKEEKEMKKLTKEQVFKTLYAGSDIEGSGEEDTEVVYFLYVQKDGTIVLQYNEADAGFTSSISWKDYGVDWETWSSNWRPCDYDYIEGTIFSICDYERMDFAPFAAVVEDLTNQANDWLEKVEQGKEESQN